MKSSLPSGVCLASFLLVFSAFSFAQNSTLTYNGISQGSGWCGGPSGCTATGFYDGSINSVAVGPSQSGGPGFVSDDYFANLSKGQTWSASGIDVASLNSGNIKSQSLFGSSIGLNGYAELAFLVNQMFGSRPTSGMQQAYSEALWYITSGGKVSYSSLSLSARVLVLAAAAYVAIHGNSLSQYSSLWLYNPAGSGAGEMWGRVSVAEGGSALMYLLLATMACICAMWFRARPKQSPKAA